MKASLKEIIRGSLIGMVGKFLAAGINFLSLPILLSIYGKADYGLVGIAMATNTFLGIMNMGVPTGAVKHFSEWVEAGDLRSLKNGLQSNMLFFTVIGAINSFVLIYLALNAESYFNTQQPDLLSKLIIILSITSFLNWYFISFQHLLMAYEKLGAVNSFVSIASTLNIFSVGAAYFFDASLDIYFFIYTAANLVTIPLNLILSNKLGILRISYFFPHFHKKEFKKIIGYSSGLFLMAIFQYIANQSQPLILSTLSINGDVEVANYRILQNITMLVSLMGGIFLQNFVPYITKVNYQGNEEKMKEFVIISTRYLSIVIFFICFYIFFNAREILTAYVGPTNARELHSWLMIWSLGLLYLNNQAISSLILSSGQFRQITVGIAIASLTTLGFSILLVKQIGVGTAAIGYLLYKSIEAIYLYSYYLPRIGKISSKTLFIQSISSPLIAAFCVTGIMFFAVNLLPVESALLKVMISFVTSGVVYLVIVYRVILSFDERKQLSIRLIFTRKAE